jgi:Kef-type K+ transport system membrane component KefB
MSKRFRISHIRAILGTALISLLIAWINGTHQYSEQVYGKYYHLGWEVFLPVFFFLMGVVFLIRQITRDFRNLAGNIILAVSWIALIAWLLHLVWRYNGPSI